MNGLRITGLIFLIIFSFFVLLFVVNEFEIFGIKFWGVRKENARREVFEQSQSYVEGKRQELIKYKHEWNKASAEDKLAIENVIRMNFANFDESKLISFPELYNFLKEVKYK